MNKNKFINLENEIDLRRALRVAYKHEGMTGLFQAIGEMSECLEIALQFAKEISKEEDK